MKRVSIRVAGLLAAFAPMLLQAAAPAPATPDLSPRLAQLAERIARIDAQAGRIDDYNSIRNLQRSFGFYYDEALWDQVVDLFAADATLEVGQHGLYVGRDSIRRYFLGLTGGRIGLKEGELSIQTQLSPVITIAPDGNTASARWRVLIQDAVFGTGANWGAGVYENRYVKQDGVWKIQRLHLYVRFHAPYDKGWTATDATLNARYGRSTAKPDRPASTRYGTWPDHYVAPMHFAGEQAGAYRLLTPLAGAPKPLPTPGLAADAPVTTSALEAQVRALEMKVARLAAVDEVENLQSAYGYYADMSMQDATSALFTQDSTLEILGRGIFVGRDRIYEYMRRLGAPGDGRLFTHMQLQPVINVSADGTRANVRARLFEMFGMEGNQAQWAEGTYENRFIRDADGRWKYQGLNGYQTFYTPYEEGWGKVSNPLMNYFPGYPPDLPHSVEYEPFPKVFVPPFHYKNPVSGR